jgi:protein-S-isoprenylcysteine O-methyltransferase Ste14
MDLSPMWVSAFLWIGFILYWNAAARNAAPTLSSESRGSRQVHQLLIWGSLLFAFGLRFPPLDRRWLPTAPFIVAAGLIVQVASGLLAVWARRHLGRYWSGAITTKANHQLVRTGPYRWVRHPIYTGMLGMFLGTAVVSGELHALLALGIIGAAYWRKIRLEEQHLRRVFGAEYESYQRHSWALIPGLL